MSDNTKIQWADATWNVLTGCTKISQGCKNCYAAELHDRRHRAVLNGAKLPAQYAKPFSEIQLHPERLEMPLHWKKPRRIFVNSMSDLFHKDVPFEFVDLIGRTVIRCKIPHIFMILTKRADRMLEYFSDRGNWTNNVWLGTSVENADQLDRINLLRKTQAAVRFISFEPLLGPVGKIDFTDIHWVIVGGESGRNARPMHPDWARSIHDQCVEAGVPFFFKQWGEYHPAFTGDYDGPVCAVCGCSDNDPCEGGCYWAFGVEPMEDTCSKCVNVNSYKFPDGQLMYRVGKKRAGRLLDGREWNEYPETVK